MLKCLAIDDEPLALRQIEKYIEKVPYLELVAASNNPLEAQRIAAIQPIDLMFVDINMPDLNGVDFVRSLITRPMIIFTTAYTEYADEGFRLDAVDYLLKPFSFADFSRAVAKAYALYELKYGQNATSQPPSATPTPDSVAPVTPTQPTPMPSDDKEFISVKADYKVSLLRTSEILYIESEGEYVRIHLADGSKITTLYRIKNMEASLPSEQFMRVHRSYIVNLGRIRSYVRGRIYLDEKLFVPIGENYKEAFQQYIERTYKNL